MKKRILSILIALVMAVGMISAATTTVFAANDSTWGDSDSLSSAQYNYVDFSPFANNSADGSENNPYLISSSAQLAGLAVLVNRYEEGSTVELTDIKSFKATATNFAGKYIKLTADIDLKEHEWVPIGTGSTNAFKGNFDGGGYTVSGMRIGTADEANATYQYAGLFGYMAAGSIKNLSVNGLVNVSYSNANAYAGGIAGYLSGYSNDILITIENCGSSVSVTANSGSTAYAGGIAGYAMNVNITNSYNTGDVTATANAGGLMGSASGGTMENCYSASEKVTADNAGGIVGLLKTSPRVQNCVWLYDETSALGTKSSKSGSQNFSGSPTSATKAQMTATAGTNTGNKISGTNYYALVDLLNSWVDSNTEYTRWHIHDGEYPTLGDVKYENGVCVCGYACDHSDNTNAVTDNGDGTHSFECSVCGLSKSESHTGSVATCVTRAFCEKCKEEYGTEDKNNHDTSLVYDENGKLVTEIVEGEVYFGEGGYNKDGFCAGGCYQPATDSDGDGYYEIDNAGKLYWFAQQVNSGNKSINGKLMNDIKVFSGFGFVSGDGKYQQGLDPSDPYETYAIGTGIGDTTAGAFYRWTDNGYVEVGDDADHLNEVNKIIAKIRPWTPIGNNTNKYSGTFEGNGKTVSGLYFNEGSADCIGVFGYVSKVGTVKNLTVGNSYFYGKNCVGSVAGSNDGIVENCYTWSSVSGDNRIGGVVGSNSGTVSNCHNTGTVNGNSNIGGVVGLNNGGIVQNCYNTGNGTVRGTGYAVGGVVGFNDHTVSNCYNTGTVSYSGDYVGGVVGHNFDGTVENCYNTGSVSGISYIGGVVGFIDQGTVSNCYYLADSETDSINGTTFKTSAQFASGEVAYLLNGNQSSIVWYQTCGTGLPAFSGETVYKAVLGCTGAYVNDITVAASHTFTETSNGFCTKCDNGYQPAELVGNLYEISNAGQLYWFAAEVNGGQTTINAKLTKDIVVNAGTMTESSTDASAWTPIGNEDKPYSGTFDGNGKTVSGLYFNDSTKVYIGLFGWVDENGTVQNVGIINTYFYGDSFVGGVVGNNCGIVKNCFNAGTISGSNSFAGGVVGNSNYANVENCYNTGTVSGNNHVGGVVGYINDGIVQNCYNTGAVSGASNVGGVVGKNVYGEVKNCYYNTDVYSGNAIGKNEGETTVNADGKTTEQFTSGEVAYLLGNAFGQTIGTDTLPAFKTDTNTVYQNQLSGCSAATFKYEYSNEQKAPVTTHDKNNYAYAKGSIVNTITATCGDCQAAQGSVTLKAPENAVYNGQLQGATVEGTIPGVEISVNYDTIKQPIDAGTYTASVTLGSVTVSVEYKIAQKVLTPYIMGRVTKVYDGTNTVPAGLTVVLDGIVGADNVTASATYTFDRPDAGTKKVNAECITLIGADVGNYTLSSSTASADVGEITKAPSRLLTAPAAISGMVYNQQAQMLVTPGTAEFGTFVYSLDSVNWSANVPTAVNAGNYTVFYKIAGDQNHLDSAPAVIPVTVAQREIGIIWGQTAFDYNGERQAPTATATGVLPGDFCNIGVNGWGVYEGTYTATARSVNNSNYKLPSSGTSCQFTITTDYDKEADKVMDAVGDAIGDAVEEYVMPAITDAFNSLLDNLFKMFQNLFN